MSYETIGTFTFADEGNGCLIGTYLEHREITPNRESCKRILDSINTGNPFVGVFTTVWIENANSRSTQLTINQNGDVYDLTWGVIPNVKTINRGRAYRQQNRLIGVYWNTDN